MCTYAEAMAISPGSKTLGGRQQGASTSDGGPPDQMQGQGQQSKSILGNGFANFIHGHGQEQQLAASSLHSCCHAGSHRESATDQDPGAAMNDCKGHSSRRTGCARQLVMRKEFNAARSNCEHGPPTRARPGTGSPRDSKQGSYPTTFTVQNIPHHYTAKALQDELDLAGFCGEYDFLHVPSLGRRIGRKSAVVNLCSPVVACKFRATFHRGRLQSSGARDATLAVVIAPVQGFAACASRHPGGVVSIDSGIGLANAMQGQGQQLLASALHNGCHTGWTGEYATLEPAAAMDDSEVHSGCCTGCSSEATMYEEQDSANSDSKDGSPTSTHAGANSSSRATTLLIQNIPMHYTAKAFQDELNMSWFRDKYDFLYMPLGSRAECKSAMLNCESPVVADKFSAAFHRGRLQRSGPGGAPLTVVVAPIQGFTAWASLHPTGVVYKDSGMHFVHSEPTVTKPPPGLEGAAGAAPAEVPIPRFANSAKAAISSEQALYYSL